MAAWGHRSGTSSTGGHTRRVGPRASRKAGALAVVFVVMGLLGAGAEIPAAHPEAPDHGGAKAASAGPGARGYFEPNHGQFPDHVRFVVRGAGVQAFLTDEGATFVLEAPALPADAFTDSLLDPLPDYAPPELEPASLFAVQLRFEDADQGPMEGTEQKKGISNNFIGNDPDKWVTGVPHYARVVQRDAWPGIDVEWHIAPQGLKFDAVVHPGADPKQVRFTLPGAQTTTLDAAGDLIIATPLGEMVKEAPYTYQETARGVDVVPSRYVLHDDAVGFGVGAFDPSRSLVIDPLVYSTYLGGSGWDQGNGIAVDDDGHAYITGSTTSAGFPTTSGAFQDTLPGGGSTSSAFVTKLTPGGDALVYSTYLGGSLSDLAHDIAVDASGSAYIVGRTSSGNFPTTFSAFQDTRSGGESDAFVTKLSPDGGRLVYSTYLGGSSQDIGWGIAVGPDGSAYATGQTDSLNFPTRNAYMPFTPDPNWIHAFVSRLTPEGDDLEYSTYLGGTGSLFGNTYSFSIALDEKGSAHVTGYTHASNFPTTPGAFQTHRYPQVQINAIAFLTKFTPMGNALEYSTYFSAEAQQNYARSVAVSASGEAYIAGDAWNPDLPTTPDAYQTSGGPGMQGFVARFTEDGSDLVYSTRILGEAQSFGLMISLAVDAAGSAYVTSWMFGDKVERFMPEDAYQPMNPSRGESVVISKLTPEGDALEWATYLGGSMRDYSHAIAVDRSGGIYVTGRTESWDFPTTSGAVQDTQTGQMSAFVTKFFGVDADFDWSPVSCPGEPITFRDRSITYNKDSSIVRSEWDFGDETRLRLDPWRNEATYTYLAEGTYTVTLDVVDTVGASGFATRTVTVPWCPPPNYPPSLKPLPCVVSSPGQQVSFRVEATVPVSPGDPASYSELSFFGEGLPAGATLHQEGDFAARFTWDVGPPDTYTFVVHVEDGGLPEHGMPSLSDSEEYCIRSLPDKPAPQRIDDSGDGVQNWHDACPHIKNPDQADASGGLDDPCDPAAPPEPGEAPEEKGPPPGGCPSQPAGPREVTARWTDGAVQITWQSDSWCPPDHFLVWNGTGHHLVDFIVAEAGIHYVVVNTDPWPEPHQYFVQAMGAGEGLFFDPSRAVASNLIDPAGCILEGARSEACLPPGIDEYPPAAAEPASPEAAAPADGAPVGLIAAAVAVVVGALLALLWRLRHAPWFVHLFTRLSRDDVLKHPVRKEIMDIVTAQPGIHYMEVLRRGGRKPGVTLHHLKVLATAGAVSERRSGRYLCYWPPDAPGPDLQEARGFLRADVAQRLLRLLLEAPGMSVAELAGRLGTHPNTVRYHLRRFEKAGLARLEDRASRVKAFPGELSKDAAALL